MFQREYHSEDSLRGKLTRMFFSKPYDECRWRPSRFVSTIVDAGVEDLAVSSVFWESNRSSTVPTFVEKPLKWWLLQESGEQK